MGVIEYRKTNLAEPGTGWDGAAERAAAEVSDLRVMCAWVNGAGDTKDDFKLPHHRARGHACVLAGVRSALHLLGATDMPDADRGGVRAHLEHHLRDFGVDVSAESVHVGGGRAPMRVTLQGDVVGRHAGGRRYDVVAMSAGQGNGLRYSGAVLAAAVPLFEGVSVLVDHSQLSEMASQTGGRSVRNVLGVLEGVYFDDDAVRGVLRVYPGPDAEWFTAMVDQHLVDRSEGRASPRIGLSAVLDVLSQGQEVAAIEKVVSVDAVFDPARGGEFVRALNQRREEMPEGVVGSGQLAVGGVAGSAVPAAVPVAAPAVGAAAAVPAAVAAAAGSAAAQSAQPAVSASVPAQREPADGSPARETRVGPADASGRLAVALSGTLLDARLGRCQLPEAMRALLQKRYGGHLFDVGDLDADVEALQAAWAASVAAQGPQVTGAGARGVSHVVNEVDRLQAVMDQLCGLRPASEALQGLRPVSGIRELYLMLTGDYDLRGVFDPQRVALANVTTATMTSLVKNAFNKVILDYFSSVDRWWEPIVAQENFASMQDLTLITLGGFTDLDTVTEGAAYTEKSWSDSEEVVSFIKKGNYVGVTLEMMDKDETRKFRAIPRRLAIAGYRTLSAAISALWTANSGVGAFWPASQATDYLFDTDYSNLGTTALSAAAWDAVIQAMYKQAEATSGERMGIRPAFLVVPIELEKTALTIMESAGEPDTADNDANVRRGSSRVVVCPEMTDTSDWLAVADPRVWPAITVGFRFGATPEVFVADQETVGSMFTNDEMRIKVRYIYAVGVGDNKPLYKSNVA